MSWKTLSHSLYKIKNKNYIATKQIDKLLNSIDYKQNDDKKQNILIKIFNIYDSLNGKQDNILINKLLYICHKEIIINNHSSFIIDKFLEISKQINKNKNISLIILIKSCKALLLKNNNNNNMISNIIDNVLEIELNKNDNDYDIKCLSSLIDFYGFIGDINKAKFIFNKISNKDLNKIIIDSVLVASMMKCLIDNNQYQNAIKLYIKYSTINHDDITKLLFVKACRKLNYDQTGKSLIDSMCINDHDINNYNIKLINALIDFYAKINCIDKAKKIYINYDKIHNNISHSLYLRYLCHDNCHNNHHGDIINGINIYFNHIHQHIIDLIEFYCLNETFYHQYDEIFKICKRKNIKPRKYILSKLLNNAIDNQKHNEFNILLFQIMKQYDNNVFINKYIDDVIFANILNGIIKTGQSYKCQDIWNKIYIKNNIKPNIECYRLAILCCSYSNNQQLLNKLIINIKRIYLQKNNKKQQQLLLYNHILTGYLNISNYEKLWREFDEMRNKFEIEPDLVTLSILAAVNDKNYIIKSMKEIKLYLMNNKNDKYNDDIIETLIGFYRKGEYIKDIELINLLKPILNKHWLPPQNHKYVLAQIEYKDKKLYFENCYKNAKTQNLHLLQIIDDLIQKTNCNYHDNNKKPQQIFEYHAEQIAFAYLLNIDKENYMTDIKINVNFRMCNNCHIFFCKMSKYLPLKTIKVIDPTITHLFVDGKCSCHKSRYYI